jgi:hypothetical protein
MVKEEAMKKEAKEAAARLNDYHSKLGTKREIDYPEGHDPKRDARLVKKALEA